MIGSPTSARPRADGAAGEHTPESPVALRWRRSSWRDPRIAVGLVLVCGSVVLGAQVLASADDTVSVLAARVPLAAGQELDQDDLRTVRLRFASPADANRYVPADQDLREGTVVVRPIGAGELVPREALGGGGGSLLELPLALAPERVPPSVRPGAVVDVWLMPAADGSRPAAAARRLLAEVPVLAVSRAAGAVGGGERQVVVGVAEDQAAMTVVLSELATGTPVLVVRPG